MANDTIKVMTAGDHPIYCVTTLKVGCTYLKNLFYYLAHGKTFPEPNRIHSREYAKGAVQVKVMNREALDAGVSFYVVRDPFERFTSLYFDKVYNQGPQSFPWIAKRLVKSRTYFEGPDISLEEHQQNCRSFARFLRNQFTQRTPAKTNPHWRPQAINVRRARNFGFRPLLLENLDAQLLQIADGRIDGLQTAMTAVSERNTSAKPFSSTELLTPEIKQLISTLYADDFALYEQVKANWAQQK